jgi:hypothetical protein
MFKYVQERPNEFSYEVRLMMKTINNELDLNKMKKDLILLLKFTELKLQDEITYLDVSDENIKLLCIGSEE